MGKEITVDWDTIKGKIRSDKDREQEAAQ